MLVPIPPGLKGRVKFVEEPAPAVDAATIAVVRDGESGLEAFLMRRQSSMAFAAGMYVFPGGRVDAADAQDVAWVGPSPADFAEKLGCDPELAHSLVVAAARETFEETGVLLAGRDADSVCDDTTPFHDEREALENHELTFAEFLNRHGLVLRADLLGVWAHWITPAFEPRRYDTRFFVAVMPTGQRIDVVSSEADKSAWVPLSRVLDLVDRGEAAMLPPTAVTCRELSGETTRSVLDAADLREVTPIEPRLVEVDGEVWLETDRPEHI